MIIPIYHTEEVPVINCGDGKVFTKTIDGGGWTCLAKEEYETQQDIIHNNALTVLGISTLIVLLWVFSLIYLFNRGMEKGKNL